MRLARNLGIEVVAEGTETSRHVEHLRALGRDFGQGCFFSRPLESEDVSALLGERAHAPAEAPVPPV